MVTNGDIVRDMNNQNLAELFCSLITKTAKRNYLHKKVDKMTEEWYNEKVIKGIKEWLDEPYYGKGSLDDE